MGHTRVVRGYLHFPQCFHSHKGVRLVVCSRTDWGCDIFCKHESFRHRLAISSRVDAETVVLWPK